jgi:hypothetical protein
MTDRTPPSATPGNRTDRAALHSPLRDLLPRFEAQLDQVPVLRLSLQRQE